MPALTNHDTISGLHHKLTSRPQSGFKLPVSEGLASRPVCMVGLRGDKIEISINVGPVLTAN